MYNHEIRWTTLVPLSVLLGLCLLLFESFRPVGGFPARPEWFWCLAFAATMRALPVESICAFAWCGFVRDMLLGDRPGSAAIAFILVGWIALYWKPLASARGLAAQAIAAGAGGFLCSLLRHALETGGNALTLWDSVFLAALGDGGLTVPLFIPMALILSLAPFRPWRERSGLFA